VSQDSQWYIRKEPPADNKKRPGDNRGWSPKGGVKICALFCTILALICYFIHFLFNRKLGIDPPLQGSPQGVPSPDMVARHEMGAMPAHPEWVRPSALLAEPAPGVPPFNW